MRKIDLHGETLDISKILVNDFINELIILKEHTGAIICGNGEVLKKGIIDMLKKHKLIKDVRVNIYNAGELLIMLDNQGLEDYNKARKPKKGGN